MSGELKIKVFRPGFDDSIVEVSASIRAGVWTCDDPKFLRVLHMISLPPGQYYPDYDLALARQVCKLYVGQLEDTRPKPKFNPDVNY